MVIVYLKNGEKAPMPDASYVKLDASDNLQGLMLLCYFNDQEVGQFKWEEVAGYTVSASRNASQPTGYEAWSRRLDSSPAS